MTTPLFTVPALDPSAKRGGEMDAVGARAWIAELSLGEPGRVCQSLVRALVLLNRFPERAATRAEILAEYRVPCARLIHLARDEVDAPTSGELRQLMIEMAYGYKRLVNEIMAQSGWLQNRQRLLTSLYFAAKYLSLEMFFAFEEYDTQITDSWRELLALYRNAEREQLHETQVEDPDIKDGAWGTIAHQVKRIFLLRLLDPARLVPGEARACFDYFDTHADAATVEPLDQNAGPGGRFVLDLEGRVGSLPLADSDTPQDPARFRFFNVLGISRQVHLDLKRISELGTPYILDIPPLPGVSVEQLLMRMLVAWHTRPERRSPREPCETWIRFWAGLGLVSQWLDGVASGSGPGALDAGADQQALQLNWSVGGCCVQLDTETATATQVGQVVLMKEQQPGGVRDWQVGIVRHLRQVEPERQVVGVQFVRGVVKPIAVRIRGNANTFPALWIYRPDRLSASSILVSPGISRPGREFLVPQGEPAAVIAVDQLVESTPSFDRFRFQVKSR